MRYVKEEPITSEEKRIWLEALRSGRFEQARSRLCCPLLDVEKDAPPEKRAAYCCLGVACVTFGPGFDDSGEVVGAYEAERLSYWPRGGIENHPQWLVIVEAATMNDQGKNFSEIADYLEAELLPIDKEESNA